MKDALFSKKIKELVYDNSQFADWSTSDDVKNQLNIYLTLLLYMNGYPPEWDVEVFEKSFNKQRFLKNIAIDPIVNIISK